MLKRLLQFHKIQGSNNLRIGILTSSRADYGIYKPLLKSLNEDPAFELSIIAFGTHLSSFFGYTVQQIKEDGFPVAYEVESLIQGDSEEAIASAMGLTTLKFSQIWEKEHGAMDLVVCLGDRYEMFAAVSALIPFNMPLAHIHGGETTQGAIDDKFRHAITQMADYHFTSAESYAEKVRAMTDSDHVYNVGALSLDNLDNVSLYSKEAFKKEFGIDLSIPTILITVHPETVEVNQNQANIDALLKALEQTTGYQFLFTMPNADTHGNVVRQAIQNFVQNHKQYAIAVENLGIQGYFSCMKHCAYMLGNSSSGIIEAASFETYVINVGDRQQGRLTSDNVINVPFDQKAIGKIIEEVSNLSTYNGGNIYWNGGATGIILDVLKSKIA